MSSQFGRQYGPTRMDEHRARAMTTQLLAQRTELVEIALKFADDMENFVHYMIARHLGDHDALDEAAVKHAKDAIDNLRERLWL